MAVFLTLNNGKTKRVRGRFGGNEKRDQRHDSCDHCEFCRRHARLARREIKRQTDNDLRQLDALIGAGGPAVMRIQDDYLDRRDLCPLTGERKPHNGVVFCNEGDLAIMVVYEGGIVRSAHCVSNNR